MSLLNAEFQKTGSWRDDVRKGHVDSIVYRSISSVCKLQGVHEMVADILEVGKDKALKRFHVSQGDWSVVIKFLSHLSF